MSRGTIVFVHGTGVRFKDYQRGFDNAKKCAQQAGISADFEECAWGDPLGVEFVGLSLPDLPASAQNGQPGEDFARWYCLYADPLFELNLLTIRDTSTSLPPPLPCRQPEWELAWEGIAAYPGVYAIRRGMRLVRKKIRLGWNRLSARGCQHGCFPAKAQGVCSFLRRMAIPSIGGMVATANR